MPREKYGTDVIGITVRLPKKLWRSWQIKCLKDGEISASRALACLLAKALPDYEVTAVAPEDEVSHDAP